MTRTSSSSLMEMLFDNALVTIQQVEAAYDGMRMAGRRLPWDEALTQVERLRTGV